jgi:ATP/maltotriose-dependent transcriptional regulator MalT
MLLTTKLSPPPLRPRRVPRPHLLARLEAGLRQGSRLTLISAPAGYGKTSLVAEWIEDCRLKISDFPRKENQPLPDNLNQQSPIGNRKFCWLSLDDGDNDPHLFLSYLIAALQNADAHIGETLQAALESPQPPSPEGALTALVNDIALLPATILLVLDDYHAITSQTVHACLAFLLDHPLQNLHLVLLTRSDPPLLIPRLRAQGQLTELRAADLRFTTAEITAFLNQVQGLSLPSDDVRLLEQRVEGWVAGIQLASVALGSLSKTPGSAPAADEIGEFIRTFTGSHHYVVEYLVEEVLRRQPEPIQDFLLRTSLLERLCAPLCDTLLPMDDFRLPISQPSISDQQSTINNSQSILEYLDHNNLFLTPLDNTQAWYRYHPLFAEVLRARLRAQVSPAEIARLHQSASRWFSENGLLDEAVEHAFAAGDLEQVAALLEASAKSTMLHGRPTALLRWAERFSPDWLHSHPRLRIYASWALFLSGQFDLGRERLQDVRRTLPHTPDTRALRGELASLLAIAATVDQPPADIQELAQEALDCLPEDDLVSRARALRAMGVAHGYMGETGQSLQYYQQARHLALGSGNVFLASNIIETIASTYIFMGRLRLAARTYQELVDSGARPGGPPFPFVGYGYLGLAEISLEQNDLEAAARYLEKGMELARQGGIGYNLPQSWCLMARLCQAQGDLPTASHALQQAEELCQTSHSFGLRVTLAAHQVRFWLAQGELSRARRWALGDETAASEIPLADLPLVVREVHLLTQARFWLAQGEYAKVLEIAAGLLPEAEAGGRLGHALEIGLLKGLALQVQGDLPAALQAFQSLLELAEPEGYVRLFVEAGEPAKYLLKVASSRLQDESIRAYVDKLLLAFESAAQILPNLQPSNFHSSTLIEPLTGRELDVLRLLAEGYSNQEIAARMVVSLNTVKKHTSNLYGKLNVTSRTQAIARARDLGLL